MKTIKPRIKKTAHAREYYAMERMRRDIEAACKNHRKTLAAMEAKPC